MFAVSISEENANLDLHARTSTWSSSAAAGELVDGIRVGQKTSSQSHRERLASVMVEIHRISVALAEYHVDHMSDSEIEQRLRLYPVAETSAVGLTNQIGPCASTRISHPETMTADSQHSSLLPDPRTDQGRQETARFGSKEPGPMADRALSAISC